jgi:hypothetical protein
VRSSVREAPWRGGKYGKQCAAVRTSLSCSLSITNPRSRNKRDGDELSATQQGLKRPSSARSGDFSGDFSGHCSQTQVVPARR